MTLQGYSTTVLLKVYIWKVDGSSIRYTNCVNLKTLGQKMNSQVLTRYARITSARFVLQFSKISGPKVFDRAEISVRFLRECSRICKDKGARDMMRRQNSNPLGIRDYCIGAKMSNREWGRINLKITVVVNRKPRSALLCNCCKGTSLTAWITQFCIPRMTHPLTH